MREGKCSWTANIFLAHWDVVSLVASSRKFLLTVKQMLVYTFFGM